MTKRLFWLVTLAVMLVGLGVGALAAPQSQQAQASTYPTDNALLQQLALPPLQEGKQYGLVAGPIDDKGFNQLAYEGLQQAAQEVGAEVVYLESIGQEQIAANITNLLQQGVDGIVGVGFEEASAVKTAAQANPNIPFITVDFPSQTANTLGLLFSPDEPAFMAGYLAAGMSQTGAVCTYGGTQIPPVLAFLVGFEHGVVHYNQTNGANIQVLGWETDPGNRLGGSGLFTGDYQNQEIGRSLAEQLFDQGCDVIFPVAGGAGLGAAAAAQERGLWAIGVDADQAQTNPEYADVYLTSVQKHVETTVYEAIKLVDQGILPQPGTYRDNYIGTLDNQGVGLAPFNSQVPQQLQDEITALGLRLIEGNLKTGWPISAFRSGSRPIVETALANATYQSEWTQSGLAPLTNGEYREQAAPGSATETVVTLTKWVAYGDVTGTGVEGAAVILTTDPGGSGVFYDLAVVVNQNGQPFNIATVNLGDRVVIQDLDVQNGQITVNMITQGPNDPMTNPTQEVTKNYQIQVSLVETQ